MAWIESHQKLKDDPKVWAVAEAMGWNIYECIGRLHVFWWWCVDHAEDGDLRRFNNAQIAHVVELNPSEGSRFVDAMVAGCGGEGFLEREPYFRVRNWWKFSAKFMKKRYDRRPERWQKIAKLYGDSEVSDADTFAEPQPNRSRTAAVPTVQNSTEPNNPERERAPVTGFVAPTLGEVRAKAAILGCTSEAAERFFNHYEAQGWMLPSGLPMRKWEPKLAEWKTRDAGEKHLATTRSAGSAAKSTTPHWKLIEQLEEQIAKHKANTSSVYHDAKAVQANPELKEELRQLRERVAQLKADRMPAQPGGGK